MRPGYVGLPAGSEKWGEKRWSRHHSDAAEAVGCVYDKVRADEFVTVAESLVHPRGPLAGKPFSFMPWWEHRVARPLYGYIERDSGLRRYQRVYVWTAKKQAKTTSVAPHIPYHMVFQNVGAQCYSAAGDREQAALVHQTVVPMYWQDGRGELTALLDDKPTHKRIVCARTNSFYQVLSSEAPTKAGIDVAFLHFDELAFQPNRYLWDILTQGSQAAQLEPVLIATSTAGYDRNGVCFEEWDYSRKVQAGIVDDPHLLVVLYEMPEDADWTDEAAWMLANPSMGTREDVLAGRATCTIEGMRTEFRKALELPSNENIFRMMRLNQWVSQESRFIPMQAWDECGTLPVMDFAGIDYYDGLDLSSTTDISAYVEFAFDRIGHGHVGAGTHFWLPQHGIEERERRDHAPYRQWAKDGHMTLVDGDFIDHRVIISHAEKRSAEIGMPREFAYDPYAARQICEVELPARGFNTVPIRQGFISLSEPTKKVLELVVSGRLHHGNNPVLRWMADNCVASTDPAGNIKLDKGKATGRIDGMAGLVNAVGRAIIAQQPQQSVYETRGILTFG